MGVYDKIKLTYACCLSILEYHLFMQMHARRAAVFVIISVKGNLSSERYMAA